mmetsp:Transcript_8275/g.6367  ORF Transcript_8275/g.6367 Transcript_8275/m.6367 type:complete len:86 (+) Transcript_8275:223-480(+)
MATDRSLRNGMTVFFFFFFFFFSLSTIMSSFQCNVVLHRRCTYSLYNVSLGKSCAYTKSVSSKPEIGPSLFALRRKGNWQLSTIP